MKTSSTILIFVTTVLIGSPVAADGELGAATTIHPDAAPVPAPCFALAARRAADLPYELHTPPARVGFAVDPSAGVRRTRDRVPSVTTAITAPSGVHGEFRAAAAVHPEIGRASCRERV